MRFITSNRAYPLELREPIKYFCQGVGIRSICWIECEDGVRIAAESPDYQYVVQAIDVTETASAALDREDRRHEATIDRINAEEADAYEAIKRRLAARKKNGSAKRARPSKSRAAV